MDDLTMEARVRMTAAAVIAVLLFFAQTWLHLRYTAAFFDPKSLILLVSMLACGVAVAATPFWIGSALLRARIEDAVLGASSLVAFVLPLAVASVGDTWMQQRNAKQIPGVNAAIVAFQKDEGHLPDELATLVPKYLPGVPVMLSANGRTPLFYRESDDLISASPRWVEKYPKVDFKEAYCLNGHYVDQECEYCSFWEPARWVCRHP